MTMTLAEETHTTSRHVPPQILADQKVPLAAAMRRMTVCPHRFLDFDTCLTSRAISKNSRWILGKKLRMRLRRKNTKKFKHQLRKMFRHLRSQ